MSSARVVVTGLGAVSPLGLSVSDMWEGLCAGNCGIGHITTFDPSGFRFKLAGQAPDFKIQQYVPKSYRKAVKLMSRDIALSVVAAHDALTDSGLVTKAIDPEKVNINPERSAVNLGAGLISCDLAEIAPAVAHSVTNGEFDIHTWGREGLEMVTPLWLLKYLPNMLACHIGIIHDLQGPSNTITCAEAAAQLAVGEAAQVIARGDADMALAGGAEAKVNPVVMIRQYLLGRSVGDHNGDPAIVCRPFDAKAKGSVFGEGAGVLVLEDLEHARKRNARLYAEVLGVGHSNNLSPAYQRLEPDGEGIRIAVEKALADAEIAAEDLDLIIPHGTGIPDDDRAEANAFQAVLGGCAEKIPVWPTKSMLSNTGAASGALDLIAAVCAMSTNTIPAAKNCDAKAEGCSLNIPTQPVKADIRHALCCSYTYGGQTAAIVIRRPDEPAI